MLSSAPPTDPVGAAAVGLRRSHVTHPVVAEFDRRAAQVAPDSHGVELGDNTAPNTERVQRNPRWVPTAVIYGDALSHCPQRCGAAAAYGIGGWWAQADQPAAPRGRRTTGESCQLALKPRATPDVGRRSEIL